MCVCVCACSTAQCCAIYSSHTIQDIYDFSVSFLVSMPQPYIVINEPRHHPPPAQPLRVMPDNPMNMMRTAAIVLEVCEHQHSMNWPIHERRLCINVAANSPTIDLNVIQFIWMLYIITYLAARTLAGLAVAAQCAQRAKRYHKFYGISNNKKILMVDPSK